MLDISEYKTFVFDCDGVILNSNHQKTDAFYKAALPYGVEAAQTFREHHAANGGISRYIKFEYFLDVIVPEFAPDISGPNVSELLESYANLALKVLLTCEVAEGLVELRQRTPSATWLIVSGSDEAELRGVFQQRKLGHLFDGGIFGSPDTKDTILQRELKSRNITQPALFLGDSKYDYQAATKANLDFIFFSDWTEVDDWDFWANKNSITTLSKIQELLPS